MKNLEQQNFIFKVKHIKFKMVKYKKQVYALTHHVKELEKLYNKYKKGYHLLMMYFDSIADEEKPKVSKELENLGL